RRLAPLQLARGKATQACEILIVDRRAGARRLLAQGFPVQVVHVDGAVDEVDGPEPGHEGQIREAQEDRCLAVEEEAQVVPHPALHAVPQRDGSAPLERSAAEVAIPLADADAALEQHDVEEVEVSRVALPALLEEWRVQRIEREGEAVL